MTTLSPFHLAFPVHDLAAARSFWGGTMGCPEGRSSDNWVDFDFYGHQIVAHLVPGCKVGTRRQPGRRARRAGSAFRNRPVDGGLAGAGRPADRCRDVPFEIAPYIRFKGQPGEQATMFFRDPSGNAIEMKAFADRSKLFATT
jgi:uncharacterized protein